MFRRVFAVLACSLTGVGWLTPTVALAQGTEAQKDALKQLIDDLGLQTIKSSQGGTAASPKPLTGVATIFDLSSDDPVDRNRAMDRYRTFMEQLDKFRADMLMDPGKTWKNFVVVQTPIDHRMLPLDQQGTLPVLAVVGRLAENGINGQDVVDEGRYGAGTIKILMGGNGRSFEPGKKGPSGSDGLSGGNGGKAEGFVGPGDTTIAVGGDGGRGQDGADTGGVGRDGGAGGDGGGALVKPKPPQRRGDALRVGIAIGGRGREGGRGGDGETDGGNGKRGGNAGVAVVLFNPDLPGIGIANTRDAGAGGNGGNGGLPEGPSGTGGAGGPGGNVILARATAKLAIALAMAPSGRGGDAGNGLGQEGVGGNGNNGGTAGAAEAEGGDPDSLETPESVAIATGADSGRGGNGGRGEQQGGNGMDSQNGGDASISRGFQRKRTPGQPGAPGMLGEIGGMPGKQGDAGKGTDTP